MKRILTFLIVSVLVCYPFAVYFGLHYFSPRYIALTIAFLLLLRFVLLQSTTAAHNKIILTCITLTGVAISIGGTISNNLFIIKLYPCAMSMLMLGIFAYSLWSPPSVIEKLARLITPDLPPKAIQYTYKVTLVWCMFFILNGCISLWTALLSTNAIWVFYNGFLSYLLIGTLFMIELMVRKKFKNKWCEQ